MAFKLTITDRYNLLHDVARLPSTVALRYAIDDFQKIVDFAREEIENFKINIDKTTYEVTCSDPEYTIEVDKFPDGVTNSMKRFISKYDIEEMKTNQHVQDVLARFKKVI